MRLDYREYTTPQQVFDACLEYLLTMERPCRKSDGECAYREDPNNPYQGSACPVGVFIPDDIYHPALENTLVTEIDWESFNLQFGIWMKKHELLLVGLQYLHDFYLGRGCNALALKSNAKALAEKFELEYPETE